MLKGHFKQSESLKSYLFYDGYFSDEDRDIFVLADGAIGTMWELESIAHEFCSENELNIMLNKISKIFEMLGTDVTLQFIYEARPSSEFPVPDWYKKEKTFFQESISKRIEKIQSLINDAYLRPIKRNIYLALKVHYTSIHHNLVLEKQIEGQALTVKNALSKLRTYAQNIEFIIRDDVNISLNRVEAFELVDILRENLSSFSSECRVKEKNNHRNNDLISNQVVHENIEWNKEGVQVGNDMIEVLSWADQSNSHYIGMMAELIKINTPIRAVIGIIPVAQTKEIENLIDATKNHGDSLKERQNIEAKQVEKRILYGEKLLLTSLHILVRNIGVSLNEHRDLRVSKNIIQILKSKLGVSFLSEKYISFNVFLATLPFGLSKVNAGFIARSFKILSGDIKYYLPLYGGGKGRERPYQLMQNRACGHLWLNPRMTNTNSHIAVLASSGSGKSFFVVNTVMSELASRPNSMVFIIDNITSYKILAKAMGEESHCSIIMPPSEYPNIFKGKLNRDRLPVIISIIKTAIEIISGDTLTASESVLLGESITKTFKDNVHFSKNLFNKKAGKIGEMERVTGEKHKVPCLSDIINRFNWVCDQKEFSKEIGISLKKKLMPFYGSGPYSMLFDQDDFQNENEDMVGIALYDLVGIKHDEKLTAITSLIIISDILRQMDLPQNKKREGLLIIDEAGVNLSGKSEELESFVNNQWPTLRKKGVMCIGLTNKVEHYAKLPACRTMWSISSNKVILPMTEDEITLAKKEGLFNNPLYFDLISSLKKDNKSSEGLWISPEIKSSFIYVPTGYDYWLAVSRPIEIETIEKVKEVLGSYRKGIHFLANHERWNRGIVTDGAIRQISDKELKGIQ